MIIKIDDERGDERHGNRLLLCLQRDKELHNLLR